MARFDTIVVIGAGAFGTALAIAAERAGRRVTLVARDPEKADQLAASRVNPRLQGATIPAAIAVMAEAGHAPRADATILAVPTQALGEVCRSLLGSALAAGPIICAAKGIERTSGRFVGEIVAQTLPLSQVAVLSGPGFAEDIARGAPTALTLACGDASLGAALAAALGSPAFRLYHATDMRGVEIGGAAKNVLAIAAGIAAGRGFGESAVAALIARSFAELTRFGLAFGAEPQTLAGLSGLGDLILTGTSSRSRNRRLGEALGRGMGVADALAQGGLAEGAWTAGILVDMAKGRGVEMPVAEAVADLVAGRCDVARAIERLLSRPLRAERGETR